MPGYVVFMREKALDQSELEGYWETVAGTLDGRPLKVLSAFGKQLTLEGPNVEGVTIPENPTSDEARD